MTAPLLPVETVRQRVRDQVLTLPGWTESAYAYDVFQFVGDAEAFVDQSFMVGVPTTSFTDRIESSPIKRGELGGMVETSVRVRWLWRFQLGGTVSDYDSGLEQERKLLAAILGLSRISLHIWCVGMNRAPAANGDWLVGDLQFTALHRVPII